MTGKFFRSLKVGRMTEYLFLIAIAIRGGKESERLKVQSKVVCCSLRTG